MRHLTEVLRLEHRTVLDHLNRIEAALAEGSNETLRAELTFLESGLVPHRRKEEEFLFPELDRRFGSECPPVRCMIEDHAEEKAHVRGLREALDASDRDGIRRSVLALLNHLRNHIWKEENVLFPMAEEVLEGPAQERVLAGFREVGSCCGECREP